MDNRNNKIDRIGNFLLDGWIPTPVEKAFMDGTFNPSSKEVMMTIAEIPEDFLEIQDFNNAMEEIKREIGSWDNQSS